jgi:hypothetical protein
VEKGAPPTKRTNAEGELCGQRVRQQIEDLTIRFETLWRNKWLTSNARSIGEMADALQAAADELREMEAQGVVLDESSDMLCDYATLVTFDAVVAEQFGFESIWEDGDEADDAEDSAVTML